MAKHISEIARCILPPVWSHRGRAAILLSVGALRNSYDRRSLYLGGRWTPLALGPLRFGAFGLLSTGYPSPVLVLPAAVVEGHGFGVNLLAVPNLPGYSGYVGAQVRFTLD